MSNKIWKKSLTVQLIFLVIISRSFCSTFDSFYLPALIVVFDHMCLLLGSIFCKTETEATHKKEEKAKMCERLFHLNNCWLCQKCRISYSVLTAILLNPVYDTKWYVSRTLGCLGEGKKRTQKKKHLFSPLTSGGQYPGSLIEWIFYWVESSQIKNFESIFELNFPGKNIFFWIEYSWKNDIE